MKKIYDTNILIDYPEVIINDDEIVLTYSILEELESLKRKDRLKYKARKAIRHIIDRREEIEIIDDSKIPLDHTDDLLLEVCLEKGYKLLTMDGLLYLRGLEILKDCEYYQPTTDIYTGKRKYNLSDELISKSYEEGYIKASEVDIKLYENQFLDCDNVILQKKEDNLFRVEWEEGRSLISKDFKLNREQLMAHELLMDTTVPLVAVWGKYGTGKTSLTVKTAIKMFNKDMYDNILITKPKVETGHRNEHLGTLPGEVNEKYAPYLKPFEDNASHTQFQMLEVQPLSTIKGRDIKDTIFIIDEFQDLAPDRVPMIIERLGKGSKLVLLGDPRQVDNSTLHKYWNGLTFTMNNLKGNSNFGCVELVKNERSEVAMLGEELRECLT
ncbi:MAG: PhoH family protein [bacterium]